MPQFWNEEKFTWIALGRISSTLADCGAYRSLNADLFMPLLGVGVFSIFAVVTARSQLTLFKKRCEVRAEAKRDNINQETEDCVCIGSDHNNYAPNVSVCLSMR